MKRRILLLFTLSSCLGTAQSQNALTDSIDSWIQRHIPKNSPGVSILVSRDGSILYNRAFGLANIRKEIPAKPRTQYRIGSITKQFTAAAILKLQEEGRLSVQDPLSKYFPEFPKGSQVTLHNLLTHTSGIHSYTEKQDFLSRVRNPIQADSLISGFMNDPYDFEPGKNWHYSNSGYFLLGRIVEIVSGMSYEGFLKDRFFIPLGMKDTGVYRWGFRIENEALEYAWNNTEYTSALKWDMSWAGGAGWLYSTAEDLFRWNEGIFCGRILSLESLEAAWTPVATPEGGTTIAGLAAGYGYGWIISDEHGYKRLWHNGGLHGFVSCMDRFPDQNITIILLHNCFPLGSFNPIQAMEHIRPLILAHCTMKPDMSLK